MVSFYDELVDGVWKSRCTVCKKIKPIKGGVEFKFEFVCEDCLNERFKEYINE